MVLLLLRDWKPQKCRIELGGRTIWANTHGIEELRKELREASCREEHLFFVVVGGVVKGSLGGDGGAWKKNGKKIVEGRVDGDKGGRGSHKDLVVRR